MAWELAALHTDGHVTQRAVQTLLVESLQHIEGVRQLREVVLMGEILLMTLEQPLK